MNTHRISLLALALMVSGAGLLQAGPVHSPKGPSKPLAAKLSHPALSHPQHSHPAGPKVGGPLTPGGPTFGYGPKADLHTVEHGWRFREGHPERFIYVKVHNNSKRTWRDVKVLTGMYNAQGTYLRTETSAYSKPLLPGQTADETFGPVGPQDQAYTITGYKAHL